MFSASPLSVIDSYLYWCCEKANSIERMWQTAIRSHQIHLLLCVHSAARGKVIIQLDGMVLLLLFCLITNSFIPLICPFAFYRPAKLRFHSSWGNLIKEDIHTFDWLKSRCVGRRHFSLKKRGSPTLPFLSVTIYSSPWRFSPSGPSSRGFHTTMFLKGSSRQFFFLSKKSTFSPTKRCG